MKWIICIGLVFSLAACQSSKKSGERGSTWSGQMQNMAKDVQLLIPYAYNKEAYSNPENEAKIKQALQDISKQSHKIPENMGKQFLGDDPVITYSLNNLQNDLVRANHAFNEGQKDYSRSVLKQSMGHCFRCHSLTTIGSEAQWDLSQFSSLELTPDEKLDLLVAARKYEEAFKFVEMEINRPEVIKNQPTVFESLLRKHLALSLRLHEKPGATLDDLNRVLEKKELPPYLEKQVKAWRDSLKGWSNHKKSGGNFIQVAQGCITKAKKLQDFAYDHAGDVEYIWATDVLHEGLRSTKDPKKEAEAYFLLGLSYEVLDDLGSYGLHETYFEACIQKSPQTKLAKRCYDRLEASLVQGFSGSAGVSLPKDERERLDRLKKLL